MGLRPHRGMRGASQEGHPIDFVIPWVDGSDPEWRQSMLSHLPKAQEGGIDAADRRYRDYGLLRYWFRGVERCAPWVNRVFFVTNGQFPSWLDPSAKKLAWVRHEDFVPEDCLPVFSPRPLEMNLHRIPGLSEHFVYFNDDMYLLRPVSQTQYFRGGAPVANARISFTVPRNDDPYAHVTLNNIMAINRNFDKRSSVARNFASWYAPWKVGLKESLYNLSLLPFGWFPGMSSPHVPAAYLKSTYEEVWEREPEILGRTSHHRFRSYEDVTQSLFYEWQIAKGIAASERRSKLGRYVNCTLDNYADIAGDIERRRYSTICVNDGAERLSDDEFAMVSERFVAAFESIFPEKSSFEL